VTTLKCPAKERFRPLLPFSYWNIGRPSKLEEDQLAMGP